MNCPLCNTESELFDSIHSRNYYKCSNCHAIYLSPTNYLSASEEKKRYEQHQNDVEDEGYQNFVRPLVSEITTQQNPSDKGLDFGSGTGPVITKLLREEKYHIVTYDPFFDNSPERLETNYDYIVSCEVIEHFHQPYKEFQMLYSLLNKGGSLYLKTHLYSEDIQFKSWYYKDDPTHVFIYHKKTLEWIKKEFNFCQLKVENRHIQFKK